MNSYIKHLGCLLVVAISASSCQVGVKAEFDLSLDPNVPGKVIITNSSANARSLQWQVQFSDTENGTYSSNSSFGSYGYYDGELTRVYADENSWVQVTLEATGFNSDMLSKKIQVDNIPTQVVTGDLVVTWVRPTNNQGYEWDDADGTPDTPTYEQPSEYPDLTVNNNQGANAFSASLTTWDVNIDSGLPVTLSMESELYSNFSAFSSSDYFIELIDFDGQPGSTFSGPGERIGVVTIDFYRLTHEGNGGSDDSYPDIYKIVDDGFEADLYLNWD
jgi:hypothetical protein